MPSIHYLNPPPNPFWDFVAGLEDHPFFSAYGPPPARGQPQAAPQPEQTAPAPQAEMSEKAKGKQATAEDPPEVDPASLDKETPTGDNQGRRGDDMPFRGRGRFANVFEDAPESNQRGHGCRGRGGFEGRGGHHFEGRGGHHRGGPPPFMFGPRGPWWAHHGPPGSEGYRGPWGPGPHRGGPPHGHRGPHHHSPPRDGRGPQGFNLPDFLNNLGQRLGVDLSGAAEGLGLDRFAGPRNSDADFEPRADVFDTPNAYAVHVSLPGAKKEDVGVDWDGENSLLRVTGVVHRPGADEQLLSFLAVDGRKRETGVFEKAVRLGTKRDPASIDVAAISARMVDGVLVVNMPKVEVEHKKREIPIRGSDTSSPGGDASTHKGAEKASLIDADEEMHDAVPAAAVLSETAKEKEADHQREVDANAGHDGRSDTMEHDQPEQLPSYRAGEHEEDDWEEAAAEEEGEYVKINVD